MTYHPRNRLEIIEKAANSQTDQKYPVCDTGRQFIFACRRTASRLDLTAAEILSKHSNAPVTALTTNVVSRL